MKQAGNRIDGRAGGDSDLLHISADFIRRRARRRLIVGFTVLGLFVAIAYVETCLGLAPGISRREAGWIGAITFVGLCGFSHVLNVWWLKRSRICAKSDSVVIILGTAKLEAPLGENSWVEIMNDVSGENWVLTFYGHPQRVCRIPMKAFPTLPRFLLDHFDAECVKLVARPDN